MYTCVLDQPAHFRVRHEMSVQTAKSHGDEARPQIDKQYLNHLGALLGTHLFISFRHMHILKQACHGNATVAEIICFFFGLTRI